MYTFFKEIYFSKKIGLFLCCCHDVFDSEKILLWTSKVMKETIWNTRHRVTGTLWQDRDTQSWTVAWRRKFGGYWGFWNRKKWGIGLKKVRVRWPLGEGFGISLTCLKRPVHKGLAGVTWGIRLFQEKTQNIISESAQKWELKMNKIENVNHDEN